MVKKLKHRFIAVAMISVVIVIGGILAGANIANYSNICRTANLHLDILVENKGVFPDVDKKPPPEDAAMDDMILTPEAPFDTRYFSVVMNNGEVVSVDIKHIAAINAATASEMAKNLYASGGTSGFYGDYMYRFADIDGEERYIFVDCSRGMNSFRGFLYASILLGIAGVFLIFLLVMLLS